MNNNEELKNMTNNQKTIVDTLLSVLNGTSLDPAPHPLSKPPCKECGEMVCKKDMQAHLDQHIEVYEIVGQTESEAYRLANS